MEYRTYVIARNPKYDGYQRALVNIVYMCFDKKTGSGAKTSLNEGLAQKLCKSMIKKLKRRRAYARFKDNIWAADLSKMGSLSSKN